MDWTGRQLRADKRGAIPQELAPIRQRLHIGGEEGWLQLMGRFSRPFRRAAGRPQSLQRGCRVMQGLRYSRTAFFKGDRRGQSRAARRTVRQACIVCESSAI